MPDGIPAPNPIYKIPIKNVTGNANEKIQNKNLAWNGWAQDFVNRIDNSNRASLLNYDNRNCLKYSTNAGYQEYDTKYIFKTNFKENTQYTFVFDIFTANSLGNIAIEYTDGTLTSPSNLPINSWSKLILTSQQNKTIKYIRARYLEGTTYIDLDTFMVLEGAYTAETLPSYEPHEEQNYPFTFSEGQRGMQGTTLEDDGIHNIRKQKVLLNPTGTNQDNSTIISIYWGNAYCPNLNLTSFKKCSHFNKIKKWGSAIISEAKTCLWSYENISFGIMFNKQETGITTLEEARTYLVEHNIIVEWELAEEEIIPYNPTQQVQYNAIKQARSYDDITYISGSSDELAPELKIQYWKKKGGEISMKLSKDDLKKKLDERIEDEDLKIELLEDVEDSFEEVVEDTVEKVEKTMYDELETKYDELKTKYKERFFKTEDETVTEEKEDETGLAEETVYEKEDIFEETKKEED